jgi:hypothetical protein
MRTVLWISAIGGGLLFCALAGLVGLMYLLTAPWLFRSDAGSTQPGLSRPGRVRFRRRVAEFEPEAGLATQSDADDAERERRRRAVALAVATACAEDGQTAFVAAETAPDWRLLHRARRLTAAAVRQRART